MIFNFLSIEDETQVEKTVSEKLTEDSSGLLLLASHSALPSPQEKDFGQQPLDKLLEASRIAEDTRRWSANKKEQNDNDDHSPALPQDAALKNQEDESSQNRFVFILFRIYFLELIGEK